MRSVERLSSSAPELSTDYVRQRLRDLPSERAPPYDWAEFRRRQHTRAWSGRSPVKWEHAAAAAGVTVLIVSMAIWGRADHHQRGVAASGVATTAVGSRSALPEEEALNRRAAEDAELNERYNAFARKQATAASMAAQAAVAAQFAALARAQGSKHWLEQQPVEPAVVRVGPAHRRGESRRPHRLGGRRTVRCAVRAGRHRSPASAGA